MIERTKINIDGLEPGAVLAALYNAASPMGLGWTQYQPGDMTTEQGAEIMADTGYNPDYRNIPRGKYNPEMVSYFDYLHGRLIKTDLTPDADGCIDVTWYEEDNGVGTAARAIARLREGQTP